MSQWGQPGFQYPMSTGYPGQQQQQFQPGQNPQFQQQPSFQPGGINSGGFQPGGIAPQPTGFPGPRPQQGYQQPQQTGYLGPGPSRLGVLQAQPTGFPGESSFAQQGRPQPPPVPPIPSQFQQQPQLPQQTAFANPQRFGGPSPSGFGGNTGLVPQPTGFAGRTAAPLIPQVTGFVDPRLQMMSSSFLPANISAPYGAGGIPQLAAPPQQQLGGLSLQQSFQQHNQARGIGSAPKIPWTLSKGEKKQYDQIFRSWDAQGTGFISGQTALEVFGQSGIEKNELARIWTLADADNRGKLNLAEFHVAMGLIYRKLNGNDIPDELPPELIPPSSRDLDTSVNFLKDILKNDTRARSPLGLDTPVSRLKERSFNSTSAPGAGGRQDATVYKHTDAEPPGGFYQPRSRHIDRSTVRSRNEDNSPAADMSDIKRQLANTQKMLDAGAVADAGDDELDREMSDLRYRIKRLQEDLDYVSRGPRSANKEEERRRLERELMQLMHERVPELERKIEDRQARKERENREYARERDRRNERSGRFDDTDGRRSPYMRYRDDDRDRPYSRSASRYDRDDRDYDRDRSYRDRHDDRDLDLDRSLSTSTRTPPPPAAPANNISQPPPPPPPAAPSRSPAPGVKHMTPEERKAFVQAQAKKRLEERMQALGVSTPSSTVSPTLDVSVEDRLAQEKKEAEEKAKEAERQAEERERLRRERLESEKALREGKATLQPTPTPTVPTPTTTAPPPAPAPKVASPASKSRAPAPPPPRKGFASRPSATSSSAPPPAPVPPVPALTPVHTAVSPPAPVAPAVPKEDLEDADLKAREAALRQKREDRAALLRKLEEEEEEARRAEELYLARRKQFLASKSAASPTTPATPTSPVPPPPAFVPPPPPPPPPAPPVEPKSGPEEVVPTITAPPPAPPPPALPVNKSSTNPFSRMMKEGGSTVSTPAASNGSSNPFFLNNPVPPPTAPAPPKSPGPSSKTTYNTAGGDSEDDWDDVMENEENDSSDEELGSRDTRMGLAQQLFGNLLPSRPQSAGPEKSRSPAPLSPPSAPPPPPAPIAPSPPSAPFAPPPPSVDIAPPASTGDRNALLSAIQGGAKLRKAVTHDRSAAAASGKVIGDIAPPPHINVAPRPASPPPVISPVTFVLPSLQEPVAEAPQMTRESTSGHSKKESVDWYTGLAADQGAVHHLPATIEEEEEPAEEASVIPETQASEATADMMDDIDKSIEFRVWSLYPYEGQKPEDLSFVENLIITAHPSKTGGDWWYGTIVKDGKSGFFPQTYVQKVESVKANALYSYAGGNADELPFAEGDELSIIDRGEADWWKAERDGIVFIVPAAYLEIVEAAGSPQLVRVNPHEKPSTNIDSAERPDILGAAAVSGSPNEDDHADRSSDEGEDYYSMDESEDDSEGSEDGTIEDEHARELERQRVLEAAGLIVDTSSSVMASPNPSVQKRRPPPVTPQRVSIAPMDSKNLPPLPTVDLTDTELDSTSRLDDAFDRYDVFKKTNGNFNNRMSVSSFDTSPSSPPRSPAVSLAPSLTHRDWESRTSQFLSFLGRHTNRSTTPEPEKKTLVISGPIVNTPVCGETGDENPSFGTSWASLVDKSALEGIPKMERRRQEAIFELISTEADYVRDLQLIVELFYSRLMGTLGEKATTVIFANIEDILLTNTTFLSVLEERQKDCRLYIDHIGDVLETHIPNMHLYLSYCVNQHNAAKVLRSMRDSNADLATQLQRLRDDPSARNLDLSHYLLVPMQRLTRYPLLIRQILQYTDHPSTTDTSIQNVTNGQPLAASIQLPGDAEERKNISAALKAAQKILEHVNETIREQEGRERLSEISKDLWIGQGHLDLTAPTRHLGPRKLLKEGVICKAKSGRKLRLFLCSDILVLTHEGGKGLYRVPIPLNEVQIKGSRNEREDSLLRLHLAYPRGGDTIVLRATSNKEALSWKDAIERASRRARDGERRAVKAQRASSKTDLQL
ncbi:uncharacterized protein EDB93DRAFT_707815 [Suillus bovinus]|uniref:uncharacterized protein n=1 Tax=Suillus bovinus TaxID=48563 RepID=UPI001B86F541|nr:uncharacterized protein EDB93DRAFT_707815 [Suillus bovinus]KAG2139113.1 hypothetical protein EDB93DRAFT_707815 [Suillus bovinus]